MIGRVQYKRKLHIAYGLQLLQHANANLLQGLAKLLVGSIISVVTHSALISWQIVKRSNSDLRFNRQCEAWFHCIYYFFAIMFYYFKLLFLLRNTACLTEKTGILMHLVLCRFTTWASNQMSLPAESMGLGSSCLARQRSARQAEAAPGKASRRVASAGQDEKGVPWFWKIL